MFSRPKARSSASGISCAMCRSFQTTSGEGPSSVVSSTGGDDDGAVHSSALCGGSHGVRRRAATPPPSNGAAADPRSVAGRMTTCGTRRKSSMLHSMGHARAAPFSARDPRGRTRAGREGALRRGTCRKAMMRGTQQNLQRPLVQQNLARTAESPAGVPSEFCVDKFREQARGSARVKRTRQAHCRAGSCPKKHAVRLLTVGYAPHTEVDATLAHAHDFHRARTASFQMCRRASFSSGGRPRDAPGLQRSAVMRVLGDAT